MEDNDEDGDEDGFEDALEAGEKEAEEDKKNMEKKIKEVDETAGAVVDGEVVIPALISISGGEETKEASEEDGGDKLEGQEENDLVSAMQSTSISGNHISEMPSP